MDVRSDLVIGVAELGIVVVFIAAVTLEIATVSCVVDVRNRVWSGEVISIDVTIVVRVDMVIGVLIDLLTDKVISFVTESGVDVLAGVDTNIVAAAMADLEFTRVSLEI